MKLNYRRLAVALVAGALTLGACGQAPEAATDEHHPITIEQLDGKDPSRAILTEEAAKRLDIQTTQVGEAQLNGAQHKVIPYSSLIYDTDGGAWIYVNSEPLTFVRHSVSIDDIQGDKAFITDELPAGSAVVTVGATELYGAEFEFEEE
ncbi:MAG TPA: hypothetical protein PLO33_09090 [Kouleothrix sp.]|uniref:hypothetical protein n=1 Tax=Kouleothrix sp. TaxID=2779161 RepID=UPI002C4D0DDB|nr:hypothetical protein [Kouleothrix sp.]HRC75823.1 hypothetical protein [Kouleothrix sp.]